jgi:hypothetical protein
MHFVSFGCCSREAFPHFNSVSTSCLRGTTPLQPTHTLTHTHTPAVGCLRLVSGWALHTAYRARSQTDSPGLPRHQRKTHANTDSSIQPLQKRPHIANAADGARRGNFLLDKCRLTTPPRSHRFSSHFPSSAKLDSHSPNCCWVSLAKTAPPLSPRTRPCRSSSWFPLEPETGKSASRLGDFSTDWGLAGNISHSLTAREPVSI